jgi:hypothetical protein
MAYLAGIASELGSANRLSKADIIPHKPLPDEGIAESIPWRRGYPEQRPNER